MKTRQTLKNAAVAIALATLIGAGTFWSVARVHAVARRSDPPAFGIVNIVSSQAVRLNVVCSQHGVNGAPPDPCRGRLMFHDAAGNDLQVVPYVLMPGHSMSLEQDFVAGDVAAIHMIINPCVVPAPNSDGRAIPSVEVFDKVSGKTELYLTPIPRLSNIRAGETDPPDPD